VYYILYVLFHQDMHNEAFAYTQQTLAYSLAPELRAKVNRPVGKNELAGRADIHFPAGQTMLGASRGCGFVFDNEKWEHPVAYESFDLARSAVTRGEFRAFVEEGGYAREELWSEEGWRWRVESQAEQPLYWRRQGSEWQERLFDSWQDLRVEMPMLHVSWYEAEAYCRWSRRRLPSEVEWEVAAKNCCAQMGLGEQPFWEKAPQEGMANLDYALPCCQPAGIESGEHPAQLFGNVWEWTSSTFLPFDGFERDCYRDYSFPWFRDRKVLRGGAWTTASRMLRPTYRNFYQPYRRDVFAGLRTCALQR
ncbi:MAG: SUMF1/EgtB/PvdO family nonheme iron enzyme, partial [Planctomycetota bacterium]